MLKRVILGLLAAITAIAMGWTMPGWSRGQTEILWDTWGVPHISAPDQTSLFRAFGWAQAQSHGNLILRLYAEARGQAAEYGGIEQLASDQYVQLMGIPERAKTWYSAQTPAMQANLDAFAEGINNYARQHPQEISADHQLVLPVTGIDVMAHVQRVLYFQFLTNPQQLESIKNSQPLPPPEGGSNAWAIAPQKSSSGKSLLLANPHLPWGGLFRWYEAQLTAPGINLSGAALVGMPVMAIAFNDDLGWSLTVNQPHNVSFYELKLQEDGYLWNGQVKPFERQRQTLKIRQPQGEPQLLEWDVLGSDAGVILSQQDQRALAVQVAGLDRPFALEQFWQMGQAKTFRDFESAVQRLQVPMFNLLYGDRQGTIFYLYNALAPKRSGTWQDWGKLRPASSTKDLWQEYLSYDELPKLKNPSTGWLQNSNDPPWTSTFPSQLKPQNYSENLAGPTLTDALELFRTQRSLKLLLDKNKLSLNQLINKSFSTQLELADRTLPLLIPAAKLLANPIGIEAAQVLEQWDHQTNADSRGAVLFMLWALTLDPQRMFSRPWNPEDPLNTPAGLADLNTSLAVLEGVAAQMKLLYGALDVPWGEVVKMSAGNLTLAAQGGPGYLGSFRVLKLKSLPKQTFQAIAGDSYVSAVEFADPVRAESLVVYGNASQPQSRHNGDQLALYAQNKLRPVWRSPAEIQAHLEKRERF